MNKFEHLKQSVGTCDCLTKTPDPSFHQPDCKYRLIRECYEYRSALKEIWKNPGWQDPEVGYMSGHIAAGALNLFRQR